MLTYSVKPRGGVVHALEVSEALARRGHDVELAALARPGEELFRPAARAAARRAPRRRRTTAVRRADPAHARGLRARGCGRSLARGGYDVVHAQDCLSANAALALRDAGAIDHVIRTVHHVDDFTSPSLIECQDRSILDPDRVLCVSRAVGRAAAPTTSASTAGLVSNGVDASRYRPRARRGATATQAARARRRRRSVRRADDRRDRAAQGLAHAARGLRRAAARAPELDPLLLIAGGMTLFDYRHERDRFAARAAELGVTEHVRVLGPLRPTADRAAAAAPATCSRSRRSRRDSGWWRSRRWPPSCRWSPRTSTCCAGSSTDGESALLVAASATARRSPRRSRVSARDGALRTRLRARRPGRRRGAHVGCRRRPRTSARTTLLLAEVR